MSIFELNKIAKHNPDQAEKFLHGLKTEKLEILIESDNATEKVFELAKEVLDRREIQGEIDMSAFEEAGFDRESVDGYTPIYAS